MNELAVTRSVQRVELDANAVLKEAWRIYRRLFARSLGIGAIVFGVVHFLDVAGHGTLIALVSLALTVPGVALVQGGLVEVVRALHANGDDDPSLVEVFRRSGAQLGRVLAVSIISGLGIALGCLLLLLPGLALMTRWAVAIPVTVLEGGSAGDALRCSREIVRGNGWNVFKVVFATGVLTTATGLLFGLASAGLGASGMWLMLTLGSALTAPYAAHALTVVYYALREPDRPVVLEPGQREHQQWRDG